ncbi:hypothetical protein CKM354_000533100 [Cercospora kikuchii]|uniref:PAC domain-containing protein n=1 Tax=Cercospora kikuchii TaxID=84275 RepID=A0A9P3CHG3_9PEZI|nr:uncharacterized protein CKM354_000533100 [Cercospora kikuchii]GIZ42051.1 hypothetical protein CKM354_000533100 [Cercospora kikuchii]
MENGLSARRHPQRLFNKFAPSRWRQPRHVRSQDSLDGFSASIDDFSTKGVKAPLDNYGISSLADHLDERLMGNPLASPRISPPPDSAVPAYTPVPVPDRNSSVRKDSDMSSSKADLASYRLFPKNGIEGPRSARTPTARPADLERKDSSMTATGVKHDLLVPKSHLQNSRSIGEEARLTTGSPSPTGQALRGQSRARYGFIGPAAPAVITATSPINNGSAEAGSPRSGQRPTSPIGATVPDAPIRISNDAVAHLQDPSPDKARVFNADVNDVDDIQSWDLISPNGLPIADEDRSENWLEKRAEKLYSADHLRLILSEPAFHAKFVGFMKKYRPARMPILLRYLAAHKAIRAQEYANALAIQISHQSPVHDSTGLPPAPVENATLHHAARESFAELLREDLHYFIAHKFIKIVTGLVTRRITGTLPEHLDEENGRLAEVFCLTDCRLRDNPIILASEGFTRHSGGSLQYVLGRNCRFMQGPGTTVDSCRRFAVSCQERRDHTELFVNYRRDGTPFLSMVMNAPLVDSNGELRYFLGAQVDVSPLLRECAGLESLRALIDQQTEENNHDHGDAQKSDPRAKIKALSEMLTSDELDIIRKNGGMLQNHRVFDARGTKAATSGNRVLIADGSDASEDDGIATSVQGSAASVTGIASMDGTHGNLAGVYRHYILVRPAPSLRILFTSPTMRSSGLLQTPLLHTIGGSRQMRENLEASLRAGDVVTARVRWLNTPNENGWIVDDYPEYAEQER